VLLDSSTCTMRISGHWPTRPPFPSSLSSCWSSATATSMRRRTVHQTAARLHAMAGSRATAPPPLPSPLLGRHIPLALVTITIKVCHYRRCYHSRRLPPRPPPTPIKGRTPIVLHRTHHRSPLPLSTLECGPRCAPSPPPLRRRRPTASPFSTPANELSCPGAVGGQAPMSATAP
jgi:hypothetical protein